MSRDRVRGVIQTMAPVVTLLSAAGAFYVTAKAEDKAAEAVKPVAARVVELEKANAKLDALLSEITVALRDIRDEQKVQREDVKEILRHQRRQP